MEIIPFSMVNLGFEFHEALYEAIDDAIDAAMGNETEIQCFFLKESSVSTSRTNYSYLCLDQSGGVDLNNVFKIYSGIPFSAKYKNKDELVRKTGVFGAGSFSHLNVSNEVWLFTKNKDRWDTCVVRKNTSTLDYYKEISTEEPSSILSHLNIEHLDELLTRMDTILYVKKIDLSNNGFCRSYEYPEVEDQLRRGIRITFNDAINRNTKIFFNGKSLIGLDPFNFGVNGVIEPFYKGQIRLKEILSNDDELMSAITNHFKHLMSVKEILEMSIEVELLKIDRVAYRENIDKNNIENIVPMTSDNSGFLLYRNGRKIGIPAKIHTLNTQHDDYNNFRAKVNFTPIFDEIFGIQVNKNRYTIDPRFAESLSIRLKEKGVTTNRTKALGSFLKKKKLPNNDPDPNKPLQRNNLEKDFKDDLDKLEKQINLMKTIEYNIEADKWDREVAEFKKKLSEKNITQIDISDIKRSVDKVTRLLNLKKRDVIDPRNLLFIRYEKGVMSRHVLSFGSEGNTLDSSGVILQPINESEVMLNLFWTLNTFPDKFDFKILDYKDSNGIDCVIVNRDSNNYNELKMKGRIEKSLPTFNGREVKISYLECKNVITDALSINHSLALVSHLVCWEIQSESTNSSVLTVNGIDGAYELTKDNYKDEWTLVMKVPEYGGTQRVVKVIELKKIIEENLESEFEYTEADLENFLFD